MDEMYSFHPLGELKVYITCEVNTLIRWLMFMIY